MRTILLILVFLNSCSLDLESKNSSAIKDLGIKEIKVDTIGYGNIGLKLKYIDNQVLLKMDRKFLKGDPFLNHQFDISFYDDEQFALFKLRSSNDGKSSLGINRNGKWEGNTPSIDTINQTYSYYFNINKDIFENISYFEISPIYR
jgi:hypothetical protein